MKGPAVAFTVITASSELFPEPPALLSRTFYLKFKVLATEESASTVISEPAVVVAPARTDAILGKYLVGEVVGVQLLKFTPVVLVRLVHQMWFGCPFHPKCKSVRHRLHQKQFLLT